jgi:ATP-dependent Clp protease adaptor protein ClpS
MPDPHSPEGPGTKLLPRPKIEEKQKTRLAPLYHVILYDDDKHTYEYVILMLMQLFGKSAEEGYKHAYEVDKTGRSIIVTTSLERAELKRDQIRAFGADPRIPNSPGSMYATVEKAE